MNLATIIYAGAFDPPHQGHTDCAALIRKHFPASELVIVPDQQPAGASGQHKHPHATFTDRVAMCRLAFGERTQISTITAKLSTPNYTVDTLKSFSMAHSQQQRLGFVMGQDQLTRFAQWREPSAILGLADLIVVRRAPAPRTLGVGLRLEADALLQALDLQGQWLNAQTLRIPQLGSAHIHLLEAELSPASSSELRRCLETGEPAPNGWLPDRVQAYIKEKHLYGLRESR